MDAHVERFTGIQVHVALREGDDNAVFVETFVDCLMQLGGDGQAIILGSDEAAQFEIQRVVA